MGTYVLHEHAFPCNPLLRPAGPADDDASPRFLPHAATNVGLEHAASARGADVEVKWLDTALLETVDEADLAAHDALWCAPGSPYKSLDGALRAIRFAPSALTH